MKFIPAQLAAYLQMGTARRNLRALRGYLLVMLAMITAYSVAFHWLMAAEGQRHSWITGFYWTLTVMSTLGFGDITFQSDVGRAFSMLVMVSGVVFLLIVLPFAFIQLFFAPWLEARQAARTPRRVPHDAAGHVIVTHYDPIAISLTQRLAYHGRPYWVIEPDVKTAMDLHDAGVRVVVGERDKVETYRALRAEHAALIVATGNDYENTNIVFTAREVAAEVPLVSIVRSADSVDILELAGSSHVLHVPEMLGRALARRTLGGDVRASVIGRFGDLLIAEAPVTGTPLTGKRLADSRLREATGLTVVGVWERGRFEPPTPESVLGSSTALVLAGTEEQLERFSELMVIYSVPEAPVLIIGGGRVGRAVAAALDEREVPWRIVEQNPAMVRDPERYVTGSAADRAVLEKAGINEAAAAVVTTNDDAANIYLTLYVRRLRPSIQIVSRATLERNVATLHRAGADFVMSYASMGANGVFNVLKKDDVVMLAEGLDVFRHPVPRSLVGRPLSATGIRESSGCSVVALEVAGAVSINPPPETLIPAGAELILIGTTDAERRFIQQFGA
ncbi:potassium channel family protein [Longimicrobium sp.]|uniref:potassium channel family protein n=1 Tax=Longimicrobium sp. TaxID=2029185 RepID=UPI003B3B22BC